MEAKHRRGLCGLLAALLAVALAGPAFRALPVQAQERPVLYWGSSGPDVCTVQSRLRQWGYYRGPIDCYYGGETYRAVRFFQARNGLRVDGVVGPETWAALGLPSAVPMAYRSPGTAPVVARAGHVDLLARLVAAEARGEPFAGQVAVAAVVLNRVRDPRFPDTIPAVIFQPRAFESVANGPIWQRTPNATEYRAAQAALNGWDPTGGAVFFWNPAKPVSPWMWTRQIVARIGRHVFAR